MRAIVLDKFGGLDSLIYKDIPEPEPKAGHVVIQIKAFGLNHAEMHMRRGEWAEAAEVSGIECVGLVKSCPGGEFAVGAKVAALMGGLGRTINGSYAEYTRAPVSNVAPIVRSGRDTSGRRPPSAVRRGCIVGDGGVLAHAATGSQSPCRARASRWQARADGPGQGDQLHRCKGRPGRLRISCEARSTAGRLGLPVRGNA
jgi:hypothetical protein